MLYPMVSKCQIRSKVEIEQNNSQVAIWLTMINVEVAVKTVLCA